MIVLVLPAYNEAENLGPLIAKIGAAMGALERPYRVLVVDDGSTDGTKELLDSLAASYPLNVHRHPENKGLAQTLFDGFAEAIKGLKPDDVVIAMDADNTHEPSHIGAMLERLEQGSDVVVASRYQPGGAEVGLTLKRKVLSRGVNAMLKLLFPTPGVRDFTCGFRAYRAGVLQQAMEAYGGRFVEASTFAASAEILLKLRALKARISEVPLVLRYDQKGGLSKMQVRKTAFNYFQVVWRLKTASAPRLPAKPRGEVRGRAAASGASRSAEKGGPE